MVLKLYGHPNSTCTIRVLTILYEKDVPFELVTVNMQKGEHKTAEYLEKQAFGVIPYLVSLSAATLLISAAYNAECCH